MALGICVPLGDWSTRHRHRRRHCGGGGGGGDAGMPVPGKPEIQALRVYACFRLRMLTRKKSDTLSGLFINIPRIFPWNL